MMRRIFLVPVVLLVLSTISCSNNEETPVGPGTQPGDGVVTATIPPEGGTVSVITTSGTVVTLDFPAGAVRTATEITLRPSTPAAGSIFGLSLEPLGMIFFAYVDVRAELPDDTDMTDLRLFFGDPSDPLYFPTTVDTENRTLTTSLTFFGLRDAGPIRPVGPGGEKGAGSNKLGTVPVNCASSIANLEARFNGFVRLGRFEDALQAALTIASDLQSSNCPGVNDWLQTALDTACQGLEAVVNEAQSTPTNSFSAFKTQIEPVIHWIGVMLHLDPATDCPPYVNQTDVIGAEIDDYITFLEGRLDALSPNDAGTFNEIKQEIQVAFDLEGQAATMGAFDAANQIHNAAFGVALDKLREVAYGFCLDDKWHYPLSRITAKGFFTPRDMAGTSPQFPLLTPASEIGNFTDAEIFADLQFCGTDLKIESIVASDSVLASGHIGTDGGPGLKTDYFYMDAPTRGKLRLTGELNAFTCWNDVPGDDEFVFRLNHKDVHTVSRGQASDDYIAGNPLELDIETIAGLAGIVPKGGTSSQIFVQRRGSSCESEVWGPDPYRVFSWTVIWKNPSLEVCIDVPASAQAGETVMVDVCVRVIDQLDQVGFFEGIDLVLQSSGGTLQELTGTTDSQGNFQTQMTVDNSNLIVNGKTGEVKFGASVTVTATSFEGVTAQEAASVTVGTPGTANLLPYLSHSGDAHLSRFGQETRDLQEYFDPPNPGGWTFNASVEADTSFDGKSVIASANTTGSTSISVAGGVLVAFGGSASGSSQLTTSGDFTSSKTPWVNQLAEFGVSIEVVGGQVSYTLNATTSVTGSYDVAVELVGESLVAGFGRTQPPEAPPASVNQSGVLNPGRYNFTAMAGSYDRCTNCSKTANTMMGFSLTLGAQ